MLMLMLNVTTEITSNINTDTQCEHSLISENGFFTSRKRSLLVPRGGGRYTSPWTDTRPGQTPPLGRHPSGQTPPQTETATEVGGTHPTGMHSCKILLHIVFMDREGKYVAKISKISFLYLISLEIKF